MTKKEHIDDAWYQGKKVGSYIADESGVWLEKRVDYAVHHYFSRPGWACDVQHIQKLEDYGGRGVRLIARDRSGIWESSIEDWSRYRKPLNKGDGMQYLLPDQYWTYTELRKRAGAA